MLERGNRLDRLAALDRRGRQQARRAPRLSATRSRSTARAGSSEALTAARAMPAADDPVRRALLIGRLADKAGDAAAAFAAYAEMNRLVGDGASRARARRRPPIARHVAALVEMLTPGLMPRGWAPCAGGEPAGAGLPGRLSAFGDDPARHAADGPSRRPRARGGADAAARRRGARRFRPAARRWTRRRSTRLRALYFAALDARDPPPGKMVVDKLPLNLLGAPLIHRLFPDARLIFAARHPVRRRAELLHAEFRPQRRRWRTSSTSTTPPGSTISSSTFWTQRARDPAARRPRCCATRRWSPTRKREMRALVGFLGLPWDDGRARQSRATRSRRGPIATPSYAQVAQPIYARAQRPLGALSRPDGAGAADPRALGRSAWAIRHDRSRRRRRRLSRRHGRARGRRGGGGAAAARSRARPPPGRRRGSGTSAACSTARSTTSRRHSLLRAAAALAPRDFGIAHLRARVALEAGLPAIALYERALAIAPRDSARLGLVEAIQQEQGPAAAAARLDGDAGGAIRAGSRGTPIGAQLRLHRRRDAGGSPPRSSARWRRRPRDVFLWRELIITLIRAVRFEDALAAIARARAAAGPHPTFDANEAVCVDELGDHRARRSGCSRRSPMSTRSTSSSAAPATALRRGRPERGGGAARAQAGRRRARGRALSGGRLAAAGDPARGSGSKGDERLVVGLRSATLPRGALAERAARAAQRASPSRSTSRCAAAPRPRAICCARIEPEIRALRAACRRGGRARHIAQLPPRRSRAIRRSGTRRDRPIALRRLLVGAADAAAAIMPTMSIRSGWLSSAFYVALPDDGARRHAEAGWLTLGEPHARSRPRPAADPADRAEAGPAGAVPVDHVARRPCRSRAGERLTVAFDVGAGEPPHRHPG